MSEEVLKDVLNQLHARIARLETTLLTLMKSEAFDQGLPPGFSEMLTGDSWIHHDAVENESFRSRYKLEMERWVELTSSLPHRPAKK